MNISGKQLWYYHDEENKGKCTGVRESRDKVIVIDNDYSSRYFVLPKNQVFKNKQEYKLFKSYIKLDPDFAFVDEVKHLFLSDTEDRLEFFKELGKVIGSYKDITFNGISISDTHTLFSRDFNIENLHIEISGLTPSDYKKLFSKHSTQESRLPTDLLSDFYSSSTTMKVVIAPSTWKLQAENSEVFPAKILDYSLNQNECENFRRIMDLSLQSQGYSFNLEDVINYVNDMYKIYLNNIFASACIDPIRDLAISVIVNREIYD